MIKKITMAMALLMAVHGASAQDISTEITVDRTIVPEQRSAERPSGFVPAIQLPPVQLKPLQLHEYLQASQLTTILPVLEPAAYGDTIALTPYRGYAALGYFPVYNLGASAGYRFINTHNTRLGAWLQFDGNSYKGRHDSDGRTRSNNTMRVGADFNRLYRPGHLAVGVEYMYGRSGIPAGGDGYHSNVSDVKADATWWGRFGGGAYRVGADFEHFGFNGFDNWQRLGAVAGVQFYNGTRRLSGGVDINGDFVFGGSGLLSLTPYFSYRPSNVVVQLGLKADITTGQLTTGADGTTARRFHIAPDVLLGWTPSGMFGIEARITGGSRQNFASEYYNYCPYMLPQAFAGQSHVPVDARLSVNVGPVTGVRLSLYGGYSEARDLPMLAFSRTGSQAVESYYALHNIKGWLIGIEAGYNWRDIVDFSATASMTPQKADRGYYRWLDHARYVAEAKLTVHTVERLDLEVGYEFRGSRRVYGTLVSVSPGHTATSVGGEPVAKPGMPVITDGYPLNLGNLSNLDFGAAYRLTDALSVWGRVENLLCRRAYLLPAVPDQGLHGLVGVSVKF